MFEFQFELSAEDLYAFHKHHVYHVKSQRKSIRYQRLAIFLFFGGCSVYCALAGYKPLYPILFFAEMLAFLGLRSNAMINWQLKRSILRRQKEGKLYDSGPYTYRFGEDKFSLSTSHLTSESDYADFERVDVGEQAVYLYKGAMSACIFPNAVFSGEDEKDRFVTFFRRKVADASLTKADEA